MCDPAVTAGKRFSLGSDGAAGAAQDGGEAPHLLVPLRHPSAEEPQEPPAPTSTRRRHHLTASAHKDAPLAPAVTGSVRSLWATTDYDGMLTQGNVDR